MLLQAGAPPTFEIIDFRTTNLSNSKIKGLDASINYVTDVSFGTLDFGVGGNYRLQSKNQLGPGQAYESDLDFGQSEYLVQTHAGLTMGNFRARAVWNYRDGYDVIRAANLPPDEVDEFDVIDLFFGCDLQGSGWREDLSSTLNIQNVLDDDPPEYRLDNGNGYANGFTIGRLFKFGISKKF